MERLVFGHFGKFAFRDKCSGRADRGIGGRLRQFGWVRTRGVEKLIDQGLLTMRSNSHYRRSILLNVASRRVVNALSITQRYYILISVT